MSDNNIALEVIDDSPKKTDENLEKNIENDVDEALKKKIDAEKQGAQQEKMIRLIDVPIKDQVTALNVLVGFVQGAQSKGVFSFEESHKIWECIQMFKNK